MRDVTNWGKVRLVIRGSSKSYGEELLHSEQFQNRNIADRKYNLTGDSDVGELVDAQLKDIICGLDVESEDDKIYEVVGDLMIEDTSSWTECGMEYDYYCWVEGTITEITNPKHLAELETFNDWPERDQIGMYLSTRGSYLNMSPLKETEDRMFLDVGSNCFTKSQGGKIVSVAKVAEILNDNWDKLAEDK